MSKQTHTPEPVNIDVQPIDALAGRMWNGTRWQYPYLEKMVAELKRNRATVEALRAEVREARTLLDQDGTARIPLSESLGKSDLWLRKLAYAQARAACDATGAMGEKP